LTFAVTAIAAAFAAAPVAATTLFQEDFETYAAGTSLAGQGGWYQVPGLTAPMMLSVGPNLGTVFADGGIRTGDGSYTGASISSVQHSFGGINPSLTTTVSLDAFASTSYRSHASGAYLTSSSPGAYVGWSADWYDTLNRGQAKWQFATSSGPAQQILGGFDERVLLEIVLDAPNNEVYGRLTSSAGTVETTHYSFTSSQIVSLTELGLTQDFRDRSYLGVEMDNIRVGDAVPAIPEPGTITLVLLGLLGLGRHSQYRRTRSSGSC